MRHIYYSIIQYVTFIYLLIPFKEQEKYKLILKLLQLDYVKLRLKQKKKKAF